MQTIPNAADKGGRPLREGLPTQTKNRLGEACVFEKIILYWGDCLTSDPCLRGFVGVSGVVRAGRRGPRRADGLRGEGV